MQQCDTIIELHYSVRPKTDSVTGEQLETAHLLQKLFISDNAIYFANSFVLSRILVSFSYSYTFS